MSIGKLTHGELNRIAKITLDKLPLRAQHLLEQAALEYVRQAHAAGQQMTRESALQTLMRIGVVLIEKSEESMDDRIERVVVDQNTIDLKFDHPHLETLRLRRFGRMYSASLVMDARRPDNSLNVMFTAALLGSGPVAIRRHILSNKHGFAAHIADKSRLDDLVKAIDAARKKLAITKGSHEWEV